MLNIAGGAGRFSVVFCAQKPSILFIQAAFADYFFALISVAVCTWGAISSTN